MKNIYELDLHESTELKKNIDIIRVPGGWIYSFGVRSEHWTSVFVPYDNGFERSEK